MATIEDIVSKSGVSRSTVFRFLNGQSVRESSKKPIIDAMKELNYKVDEIHKHNNYVIEISISNDYDEFQGFSQIVRGVMKSADELGIAVQLVRRTGEQIDEDYAKWDQKNNTKGVLVVGKNKKDELKESKLLAKKEIPHIFINRELEDRQSSYVSTDLESGAYDLVRELIKKGHKKILVIGNDDELLVDEKKINGYKRALIDHGIEIDSRLIHKYSGQPEWDKIVKEVLTSGNIPDAFFGICDSYCIKFINIARTLGFDIPRDISVVGMDDIDMAKYSFPPLTTVNIPFEQMGIIAVKQMIHLLNYDYRSVKIMLDYSIVERGSVIDRN